MPENSAVLKATLREIYVPIESQAARSDNEPEHRLSALAPTDVLAIYRAADKYMLYALKGKAHTAWVVKLSHTLGLMIFPSQWAANCNNLQAMLEDLDRNDDTLRREIVFSILLYPGSSCFMAQSTDCKVLLLKRCPKFFNDMVRDWIQSHRAGKDAHGVRCPHCGRSSTWPKFAFTEQLYCLFCGKQDAWANYLAHWVAVNDMPVD